jgi:hypothetical protein
MSYSTSGRPRGVWWNKAVRRSRQRRVQRLGIVGARPGRRAVPVPWVAVLCQVAAPRSMSKWSAYRLLGWRAGAGPLSAGPSPRELPSAGGSLRGTP